jgi:hypothetical protein
MDWKSALDQVLLGEPIWNCHNETPLYNEHILILRTKKII